jgi:hypothetical protein
MAFIIRLIPLLFAVFSGLNAYTLPSDTLFSEKKVLVRQIYYSNEVIYHDAKNFQVIGQLPGCSGYSRLPESAKTKVRDVVWDLSNASSGLSLRFNSDASLINVRWTVSNNGGASHIAATAFKGLDLYCYVNDEWEFVGVAMPGTGPMNDVQIINGMSHEKREYLLDLPLYTGVNKLEIGVDGVITKPVEQIIDTLHPIVVYGTSITQGACASRPGMMYTSLLSRKLNREVINLGFSGNGKFEVALGEFIMSVDPSLIILDCAVNSDSATIMNNAPELIEYLESKNVKTRILFVESLMRENSYFKKEKETGSCNYISKQNDALKSVFRMEKRKYDYLYYLPCEKLIGDDHEGTVDGTHLNDLGFYRMFIAIENEIIEIFNS